MANRRLAPRAVRRPTFWEGGNVSLATPSGTNVVGTLVAEANLENIPHSTLVRIRGEVLMHVDTISGVGRGIVTMGIKLSTAAAVAGATVEGPNTEIGSDWIWWQTMGIAAVGGTVAAPALDGNTIFKRIEIDSKAMRKVGLNQVLVFAVQHTALVGTQSVVTNGAVRVLFKR